MQHQIGEAAPFQLPGIAVNKESLHDGNHVSGSCGVANVTGKSLVELRLDAIQPCLTCAEGLGQLIAKVSSQPN